MTALSRVKIFIYAPSLIFFYTDLANQHKLPWEESDSYVQIFTTNLELDKFFTKIGRQKSYSYAANVAKSIFGCQSLTIIRATIDDEKDAVECFVKFGDKKITFAESVAHVLKTRHEIDNHFPYPNEEKEKIPFDYLRSKTKNRFRTLLLNNYTPPTPSGKTKLFIDTAAFLAKFSLRDSNHKEVLKLWEKASVGDYQFFTSNYVLEEFFTLLAKRVDYKYAGDVAKKFLEENPFVILRPDHKIEQSAVNEFNKNAAFNISFTDCISFVLMRAHEITLAFTFDSDFKKPGNFSIFNGNIKSRT